ncbi:protocatechuate 3,4-dioxygenase subunit alpha [Promicromonospora alba]|uniref:Protocatechuate 3,4-dioxygenase subunit alpha n=1 Tax=Promicromonospora alba TaxID=1616110 RepID=A0ABV9HMP4_9MICO
MSDPAARRLLPPTPGQTVGPFFGYALPYPHGNELVEAGAPGAVRLHGTVYDGAGVPVPDALIEIWQADPAGAVVRRSGSILRDGTFTGWGRAETDREGGYWFRTLRPGATEPGRAPFFAVTVFARGLQDRLFTRAYLPDAAASEPDALLGSLRPERRATLFAHDEPDGSLRYGVSCSLRFDIRLQGGRPGEEETVFLTYDRTDAPAPDTGAAAAAAGRDGIDA